MNQVLPLCGSTLVINDFVNLVFLFCSNKFWQELWEVEAMF